MPLSHDVNMRHTLFVVKEATSTRKIVLPADWHAAHVQSNDQLLASVERAFSTRAAL